MRCNRGFGQSGNENLKECSSWSANGVAVANVADKLWVSTRDREAGTIKVSLLRKIGSSPGGIMKLSGRIGPIIFSLIFATGFTLTLPYLALGAASGAGRSGGSRGAMTHRQHVQRFGGFVGWGWGEPAGQQVIIIQQSQPALTSEPREPAKKEIYVPPRWVDGGYGVQVLEPGYWVDSEKAPRR